MRLTRIYTPQPLAKGEQLTLESASAHHLARVLRAQVGDAILLFNGSGLEHHARIDVIGKNTLAVLVGEPILQSRAPLRRICLYQGLPRLERFDLIIQKAVELGASQIVPILTQHCQTSARQAQKKLPHWQQVVISASEQCWRSELASISLPMAFKDAIAARDQSALHLFFDVPLEIDGTLIAPAQDLAQILTALPEGKAIHIWIGPEGGFSKEEAQLAASLDFAFISLGKRILRTETAAISALALCQYLAGDLH